MLAICLSFPQAINAVFEYVQRNCLLHCIGEIIPGVYDPLRPKVLTDLISFSAFFSFHIQESSVLPCCSGAIPCLSHIKPNLQVNIVHTSQDPIGLNKVSPSTSFLERCHSSLGKLFRICAPLEVGDHSQGSLLDTFKKIYVSLCPQGPRLYAVLQMRYRTISGKLLCPGMTLPSLSA